MWVYVKNNRRILQRKRNFIFSNQYENFTVVQKFLPRGIDIIIIYF